MCGALYSSGRLQAVDDQSNIFQIAMEGDSLTQIYADSDFQIHITYIHFH